jgi:ribosomal-protein-alanine N-acetyltransferase
MLNHAGTQQIITDRLILRQHKMSDADDMFHNWVTDPEVSRFWGWEPHKDIDETKEYLASYIISGYSDIKTYNWIIVLKNISQAIGYIYLNGVDEADGSIEVHFALSRKYWNQGIMPEACKSVLAFAFSVIGVTRVHTRHHTDNPASGRVLQKCGMRYLKTAYWQVPDCEQISGEYCYYEITADDWKRII